MSRQRNQLRDSSLSEIDDCSPRFLPAQYDPPFAQPLGSIMKRALSIVATTFALLLMVQAAWALPEPRSGEVSYEPAPNEEIVAERFRLEAHTFPFQQVWIPTASKSIEISQVTFPSPVETPHESNNTVHAEYFRPVHAEGKIPGVIVLHILGGDFDLARLVARQLAHNNIAALFIKLPYYGPRSEPGVKVAMVDEDPHQTVAGFTQAVLDIRRGAAWLAAQDEVDPEQLGITGISLGITTSLAATAEPRFGKICPILAGGDVARIGSESPEAAVIRERFIADGGSEEELIDILRPIDPCSYGENVHGRRILMLNASNDEVVPPACTDSLWKSFGEPEIVWYDAGHYSFAKYFFDAIARATRFFSQTSSKYNPRNTPERRWSCWLRCLGLRNRSWRGQAVWGRRAVKRRWFRAELRNSCN